MQPMDRPRFRLKPMFKLRHTLIFDAGDRQSPQLGKMNGPQKERLQRKPLGVGKEKAPARNRRLLFLAEVVANEG